jgi:hypothetical protein
MQSVNGFFRGLKKIYHKEDLPGKIILICFSVFVVICLCSIPLVVSNIKSSDIPTIAVESPTIPTFPTTNEPYTSNIITIILTEEPTITIQYSLNSTSTKMPLFLSTITPSVTIISSSYITPLPNFITSPTLTQVSSAPYHLGCIIQGAYPDPTCTPGAIFNVTKAQICVSGYSSSVRAVSETEKNQVFAKYGITSHTSGQYEVDHFVSLELGGSNDITNLWPEPASPVPGFHEKDKVENYLHQQVCSGALTLEQAQTLERLDWVAVYYSIGIPLNTPIPTNLQVQPSVTQPGLLTPTSSGHPTGSTGLCVDGTYTSAQHKQGACSYHGGVQEWWGP